MTGTTVTITPKREKFIAEFAVCGNAAEAARRAGFSERSAKQLGSRLTKVDLIQRLVAEKRELQAVKLEVRQVDVIAGIFSAIKTARLKGNAGVVIRGWCEVARMMGLDKAEVPERAMSASGERLLAKLETMSTEDLVMMAEGQLR